MKNNIDSNFAIAILALVAACVGFSFWIYTYQGTFPNMVQYRQGVGTLSNQQLDDNMVVASQNAVFVESEENMGLEYQKAQLSNDSSDWKKYVNEEIGVSFEYNSAWGDPILELIRQDNQALNIRFAENDHLNGMVMSTDFYDGVFGDGRGGSLTLDSLGFNADEKYIEHHFRDVEKQKVDWVTYNYVTSQSGYCGYSTELVFFTFPAFHGVCNTGNSLLPTITMATNQHNDLVEASEFTRMIESFEVIE